VEFDRFLDIAFGSVREVGYLIDLSHHLGFLSEDATNQLTESQLRVSGASAAIVAQRTKLTS
jgi:four helix bundle protein